MFASRVAMASVMTWLTAILASSFILSTSTAVSDQIPMAQGIRLTKLIEEIRRLSELNRLLELKVQQALVEGGHGPMTLEMAPADQSQKRDASWDLDYGWGGGRFGKRADALGIAGRFGRSIRDDESKH